MHKIIEEDIQTIINSDLNFSILNNKTVLITGATGMLASYIVLVLLYLNKYYNYNINIIAIARNKDKFNKIFCDFINDDKLKLICINLSDLRKDMLDEYTIHYIMHTASTSMSDKFLSDPLNLVNTNILATNSLLEIAKNNPLISFLFFSSGAVYNNSKDRFIIEDKFEGINPLSVSSLYSGTKFTAELLCNIYHLQFNIPIKIARIIHTYSPTMNLDNDTRVFAEFVKNIINNENIIIKSDGKGLRAFCYIVDAVSAFFKILIDGKDGEAYNVANNNAVVSINELANILINMFPEKKLKIIYTDKPKEYLIQSADSLKELVIDTKKLESLNWKAKYDIKTGFKRVIDYFENKKKDKNEKN